MEQVNGLIRRFLPKGTNFHELEQGEINRIEKLLNNRPRKCLNFQTPYEVFRKARGALRFRIREWITTVRAVFDDLSWNTERRNRINISTRA